MVHICSTFSVSNLDRHYFEIYHNLHNHTMARYSDLIPLRFIGEFSCLKAEFHLQRSIGFHLVQSYMPTVLIVVISWVSFWLDVEAIPARITLGVTTLLTISSKSSGIQSNLPPVSYVKAIDVWMGACTTFVFTALLEFTFVNYLWRKRGTGPPNIKVADENISLRLVRITSKIFVNVSKFPFIFIVKYYHL